MIQSSTKQGQVDGQAALPAHLIALEHGGEWALWRWIGLRSAGFSHELLRPLSSAACVEAAEHCLTLEHQEQVETADFAAARTTFETAYRDATLQTLHALHHIAQEPRFREALAWQNRHVIQNGVDVLLAGSASLAIRSSKYRQKEALVTSYIQRYCTKNDTIGFFGPVGWAYCRDEGPLLTIQTSPELLASRTTYFEGWCIDTLAEQLASDEEMQPWLVPRVLPHIWFKGTQVHLPLAPPVQLAAIHSVVLAACDGIRSARQIASALLQTAIPGLQCEADVYAILRDLRVKRRIAWSLEVSVETLYPEQRLREKLTTIGEEKLRSSALAALDQLEAGREALTHARGNVERLNQAMENLESIFVQLTNRQATRRAGSMYAGRTLVYEDCRRAIQVEIGPEFLLTLGPPLSLLLTSARWFTYEAAALYQNALGDVYDELCHTAQTTTVSFGDFWLYAHSLLFDRHHPLLATLCQRLQQRWQAILTPTLEEQRITYRVNDIQQAVEDAFAAPQRGWDGAYYHCPDLMLAAPSLEHVHQGHYYYVLGELHPGGNTLRSAFFSGQHPSPEELSAAIVSDHPGPLILPVFSREAKGVTTRLSNSFVRPQDWRLVFARDSCDVPPTQRALPISQLEIEREGPELLVSTRDRVHRWKLIDVLGDILMTQILHHFSLLPPASHMPRIMFDRLVVQRETWRLPAQSVSFASIPVEAERFLTARRWMHTHQFPRRVFVKTPAEPKPFFLDFDSLVSIDVCARAIRRAAQSQDMITISEMLPDLEETWLLDHQKRPYTCELRLVAVDRRPY